MRCAPILAAFVVLGACQAQPAEQADTGEAEAVSVVPSAAPSAAAQQAAVAVACAADETPIFSCKFADGKRVAVCGAGAGKGRYRFGSAAPELALSGGQYAYTMYSGGGEGQIAFENGDTRYIVFSRMVRTGFDEDGNKPAISDGIVIERAGMFQQVRVCDDPDVQPIDVNAAQAIWEEKGELFTDETIRADPFGNE